MKDKESTKLRFTWVMLLVTPFVAVWIGGYQIDYLFSHCLSGGFWTLMCDDALNSLIISAVIGLAVGGVLGYFMDRVTGSSAQPSSEK